MTNKEPESLPTLDEAIQLFAQYARGEGDFDELDLKEVIYAPKPDVNKKDETVESILDEHAEWYVRRTLQFLKEGKEPSFVTMKNEQDDKALAALEAHYKAKYEGEYYLVRKHSSIPVISVDGSDYVSVASLQPKSQKEEV